MEVCQDLMGESWVSEGGVKVVGQVGYGQGKVNVGHIRRVTRLGDFGG